MRIGKRNDNIQSVVLLTMALVLSGIIFIADIFVSSHIAVSVLYCIVILYSWLLPGNRTTVYTAIFCTILIFISDFFGDETYNIKDVYLINNFIAFIAIWICVALVSLAKHGFKSFENLTQSLEDEVEKRTSELKNVSLREKRNANLLATKNKALSQFAHVASHDLQEPLITISQTTELISKRINNSDDRLLNKYLEYLHGSTTKMQLLVRGLMDYSRLGSHWELQKVDVNNIITELKHEVLNKNRHIKANLSVKNTLPKVSANREDLKLLFQILLDNSLKFREHGAEVKIEIDAISDDGFWEFTFCDNGIGIPKRYQSKIFVIYKRLNKEKDYEGIGLGLSLAKKIIELHDGEIWVESEVEKGSTFHFTIPK
ncbi:hypothetical protein GCM10027429_11910 [Marivirga atlantica]|jgi:signal transduction histidine kinase|uniref:histidine kinase n=1 Tax=Marivirga atlantica TaxID=1548457 RepID=A0A937AE12_9BACT|nr:ATP-binding protein [Marivirga atlantica]MBL0764804.1 hypothetical protein [Marivirga atlantica]